MRRNAFGEPRPETFDEIAMVMDDAGLIAADAQAEIFDSRDEEEPFTGWTAEISNADDGEHRFSTCGFPDREGLISGLSALGISLFIEP